MGRQQVGLGLDAGFLCLRSEEGCLPNHHASSFITSGFANDVRTMSFADLCIVFFSYRRIFFILLAETVGKYTTSGVSDCRH